MDTSPPVLRVQGQNDYIRRVKNDNNQMPQEPKNTKLLHKQYHPNSDSENQDPVRKLPLQRSRLPVPIKSNQTVHASKWEEKLLPGKAKKRKSCTRPMPFTKFCTQKHKSLKTNVVQQLKSAAQSIQPKNSKALKCPLVQESTVAKDKCRSHGTVSGNSKPENVAHHSSSSSSSSDCLYDMTHLSLKEPTESSHPNNNVQENLPSGPFDKAGRFLPNKAALQSIRRNEGVSVSCQPFLTPNSQSRGTFPQSGAKSQKAAASQNMGPQTVPIKKNLAATDKAVHFQPDPASLLSILRNEGVCVSSQSVAAPRSQSYSMFPQRMSVLKRHEKGAESQTKGGNAIAPMRAIPRKPTSRGTFIDTPQRVAIKKSLAAPDKAVQLQPDPASLLSILHDEVVPSQSFATPRSQSSAMFPQRVSIARSRKKDAASQNKVVKALAPTRATPRNPIGRCAFIDTPQGVPIKKNLSEAGSKHKEDKNLLSPSPSSPEMKVVQTLFVHQEDGQTPNKGKEAHPPLFQASPIKDEVKMNTIWGDEEEHRIDEAQPFITTMQRESVIFFSTGKKQLRVKRQESSARRELPDQEPSELVQVDEPISRVNTASHVLHREKKNCVTDTSLALLSKRRTHMEDLQLDQEVAFYTSRSLSGAPMSRHSQPCCSDPVASLLHFEESVKFVPLRLDVPSPSSSPLQEDLSST
ncbi:uncharacterized protein troap isoform X2 [Corythoichthys intestinalis]|uniref:uncharacterized protein troap isoform X2 n=1 Tax=Corythoichthys intestinalis TaxID=161448 RepID=UPI0025A5BD01|nr:uncharacterized protein troap isoform X2 [Corythoichthys intestinalis]